MHGTHARNSRHSHSVKMMHRLRNKKDFKTVSQVWPLKLPEKGRNFRTHIDYRASKIPLEKGKLL